MSYEDSWLFALVDYVDSSTGATTDHVKAFWSPSGVRYGTYEHIRLRHEKSSEMNQLLPEVAPQKSRASVIPDIVLRANALEPMKTSDVNVS